MKIKVDRCYRVTDEDHNVIMSFVVSGYERKIAEMAIDEAKKFTVIELETKEYKSKRTLQQNKYFWEMLTKLAMVTAHDKSPEILNGLYCGFLETANVKSDYILALPETEKALQKAFRAVRAVPSQEREIKGKKLMMYQVFDGSSKFNTKEMGELIDLLLDKCAEFGIADLRNEWKE